MNIEKLSTSMLSLKLTDNLLNPLTASSKPTASSTSSIVKETSKETNSGVTTVTSSTKTIFKTLFRNGLLIFKVVLAKKERILIQLICLFLNRPIKHAAVTE